MTDQTAQPDDLPARLQAVLTERYTELGNPFSEMRRQEQGPDGWPASHPVGPHGVAEVLRELLAAVPVPPPADQTALRDRIADALYRHEWPGKQVWVQALAMDREVFEAMADAVLAVLPEQTDRAAVLAESSRQEVRSADDAEPGFMPPAAETLPLGALDSATAGASALDAWARTPQGRNFVAHALVQLARDGWLRTEPGEGFEPVRDRDDVPEPQAPAELRRVAAEEQPAETPMFGSLDCTCIPFTRQGGKPRYCGPTDTVDMISGWEIGRDCPHHKPAVGEQPAEHRKRPLTLSTPCAVCKHPYNWHTSEGCQADGCGCIAFAVDAEAAVGEQPETQEA